MVTTLYSVISQLVCSFIGEGLLPTVIPFLLTYNYTILAKLNSDNKYLSRAINTNCRNLSIGPVII